MPLTLTHPLFGRDLVDVKNDKSQASVRAAQGFAAILGRMLARTLLHASSDQHDGFLGMGGGASGQIYSSFMVNQLGKLLARSASMKPLVEETAAQLGAKSGVSKKSGHAGILDVSSAAPGKDGRVIQSSMPGSAGTWENLPSDGHGPLLLPLPSGAYSDFTAMPPPSED
ncbi:MAG: hypothetical protein ACREP6_04730 [Candidatus Binataceae bacterium]